MSISNGIKRRRAWGRIVLSGLALLVIAGILYLKLGGATRMANSLIRRNLSFLWLGTLTFRQVDLNFFAPTILHGASLRDRQGREWLSIERLRLTLGRESGFLPVLTEVMVDGPSAQVYIDRGKCEPPCPMSWDEFVAFMKAPTPYADLAGLILRDASFCVSDDKGESTTAGNIALDITWKPPWMDVRFSAFASEGDDRLNVMGRLNDDTSEFNAMAAFGLNVKTTETVVLLTPLISIPGMGIQGKVTANLSVKGRTSDKASLQVFGNLNVNDGALYEGTDRVSRIAGEINLTAELQGQEGRITAGSFNAGSWSLQMGNAPIAFDKSLRQLSIGLDDLRIAFPNAPVVNPFWAPYFHGIEPQGHVNLHGSFVKSMGTNLPPVIQLTGDAYLSSLAFPLNQPLQLARVRATGLAISNAGFRCDRIAYEMGGGSGKAALSLSWDPPGIQTAIEGAGLPFADVFRAVKPDARMSRGILGGTLALSSTNLSVEALLAEAHLTVTNTDLDASPLFTGIADLVGLGRANLQGSTDMSADMNLQWPVLTLQNLRIANRVAGFALEPGGTYNVSSGILDCYLVAASLQQSSWLIFRPVSNLAKTLSRLHLRGQLSDPIEKLVHKEPVQDIAQSTVGLVKDTVQTTATLGQDVLSTLWLPFSSTQPATNAPASAP